MGNRITNAVSSQSAPIASTCKTLPPRHTMCAVCG